MGKHDEEGKTQSHYSTMDKKVYTNACLYAEGPFKQWQIDSALAVLGLDSRGSLADLGGGNGAFSASMARQAKCLPGSVALVDPSVEMLAGARVLPKGDMEMIGSCTAQDIATWASGYDALRGIGDVAPIIPRFDFALAKECVHHMGNSAARQAAWTDLRRLRLTGEGKLLIMTRPRNDIDYPFFEAAQKVWIENQPDESALVQELHDAGFTTAVTRPTFECRVKLGE